MNNTITIHRHTTSQLECTLEIVEPVVVTFRATTTDTANGNWTSLNVQIKDFKGGAQPINETIKWDLDHVELAIKIPYAGKFSVIAKSDNHLATARDITVELPRGHEL